jgi:hypothetical protein
MQNWPVFRAHNSKHLTDYVPEYNTRNFSVIYPLKIQMLRFTLQLCIKFSLFCTDVFLITEDSGARLPYLQGHFISVDTLFITLKPSYNAKKRTEYFVLLKTSAVITKQYHVVLRVRN